MSAASIDPYCRSNLDRSRKMGTFSPTRASIDRQTGLAQLKLVSKYYGYSNCPYPPPSPEFMARTRDRGCIGSAGSPPSLIDDRTDSELSHDDDYQYHASTSQIWDSFWVARTDSACYPTQQEKHHLQQQQQQQQQHKLSHKQEHPEPRVHYPALIPSPHIKRAKKPGAINYDDNPRPPKPAGYTLTVRPSVAPQSPTTDRPEWPLRSHEIYEKPQTIRAVESSYSLFPKQTMRPCSPQDALSPPPRTSSLPRVVTPALSGPSWMPSADRKLSHPKATQHRHHHSETVPRMPTSDFGASPPAPRPHTSHGTSAPQFPDMSPPPSSVAAPLHHSDPTGVTSTIPLFPSTNLVDLINPRSPPTPPGPPRPPTSIPKLTQQKSFFDFDSDSESEPEGRFSRLVRGKRHKQTQSTTAAAAQQHSSSNKTSRKSIDRPWSRPRAPTGTAIARRSHEEHEPLRQAPPLEESEGRTRRGKEGRKSNVFGRMFGRSGRGH
ncbi:hypothetical protein SODALDRAFT_328736 [Sodiomyces alkalinus F11]|uniref:Pal1-domain-containing protein n=1 Tax=Sodiomyces alkalinus (strain CBS 110278 / VKM F-3762 / F11) TaxID=1314773 RepID=A0A3N2PLI5_SODAK|nr:hypothetical protein SODALDRAFT_328736 [Sodiomyces alkalinus F11]ROT35395.1 hypothetical protein SODALDRAFT_328736 [Sodiomyces alkalinus F11]